MPSNKQILSENLQYQTLQRGLSQTDLAGLVHLPEEVIACYEYGLMMPSEREIRLLATALDVPANY